MGGSSSVTTVFLPFSQQSLLTSTVGRVPHSEGLAVLRDSFLPLPPPPSTHFPFNISNKL